MIEYIKVNIEALKYKCVILKSRVSDRVVVDFMGCKYMVIGKSVVKKTR